MARKKTEQPPMSETAVETELKAVRLYLPENAHWALRKLAAEHKTNMAILARQIVMEYLARHAPKDEGGPAPRSPLPGQLPLPGHGKRKGGGK